MKLLLMLLLTVTAMTQATIFSDEDLKAWNDYKAQYSKDYPRPADDEHHLKIFLEHKDMINKNNEKYARGEVTYKMGYNAFSDMTEEQFSRLHGLKPSLRQKTPSELHEITNED